MNRNKKIIKLARGYELVHENEEEKERLRKEIITELNHRKNIEHTKNSGRNGVGFLGHHFFPDMFPPQKYPDFLAFPTHVHKEKLELVLPVSPDNRIFIYFSPTSPLSSDPLVGITTSTSASFSQNMYLITNTSAYNVNAAAPASNIILVNGAINTTSFPQAYYGIKNGESVLKARLLSAHLKLEYTGKVLEASGIIKAGMNIRKNNTSPTYSVNTDLQNFPVYKSFTNNDDILLQYRYVDDTFYQMGPYDASEQHAFFIVSGESLPTGGSFKLTIERVFESIVKENVAELINPVKEEFENGAQNTIKSGYGSFKHDAILKVSEYEEEKNRLRKYRATGNSKKKSLPNNLNALQKLHSHLKESSQKQDYWKNNIKDWGYLFHHYFPDKIAAKRYPDYLSFPTTISSSKTEMIIPISSDSKIAMYWNPAISIQDLTMVHFAASTAGPVVGDGTLASHAITSGTGSYFFEPTPISTSWSNKLVGGAAGANFISSRLLSAYIEVEYIGKPLDASGLIRVVMYPRKLPAGTTLLTVSPTNLLNQPLYGSFKASEKFVVFYRHIDDSHFLMGPYSNATQLPTIIVYGDNLTVGGSFKVTITRTFEGIPDSNLVEFTNPLKEDHGLIGATHIKEKYGQIDVPAIISSADYNKKFDNMLGGVDMANVYASMTPENYELSLYKKMKQNSGFTSGFALPTIARVVHTTADSAGMTTAQITARNQQDEEDRIRQIYQDVPGMQVEEDDDYRGDDDDDDADGNGGDDPSPNFAIARIGNTQRGGVRRETEGFGFFQAPISVMSAAIPDAVKDAANAMYDIARNSFLNYAYDKLGNAVEDGLKYVAKSAVNAGVSEEVAARLLKDLVVSMDNALDKRRPKQLSAKFTNKEKLRRETQLKKYNALKTKMKELSKKAKAEYKLAIEQASVENGPQNK